MGFAHKPALLPDGFVRRLTELIDGRNASYGHSSFTEEIERPPIILNQLASQGRTLIEKFEFYAGQIDVAFVLLTPDDIGQLAESGTPQQRARQNVVFELGYFVARLRRLNGTVIVWVKGAVDLPSDWSISISPTVLRRLVSKFGAISRWFERSRDLPTCRRVRCADSAAWDVAFPDRPTLEEFRLRFTAPS